MKTSSKVSQRDVSLAALQQKDLYTLEETAYRMSTTLFAVRTLCRDGALKYIAIGHAWLVSPDAIKAYIREQEKAAGGLEPASLNVCAIPKGIHDAGIFLVAP